MKMILIGAKNPETIRVINAVKRSTPNIEILGFLDNDIDKNSDFYKKYNKDLESKELITTFLRDEVNDMKIIIEKEKVTLISEGSINLVDAQLNELLLSYKSINNKKLKITICENCKGYDY